MAIGHTFSEEVVGAIFIQGDGKTVPGGSCGVMPKSTSKGSKRSTKGSKKGQKQCPQWVTVTFSSDADGKATHGSDECSMMKNYMTMGALAKGKKP
jgi:hypothetical protein